MSDFEQEQLKELWIKEQSGGLSDTEQEKLAGLELMSMEEIESSFIDNWQFN